MTPLNIHGSLHQIDESDDESDDDTRDSAPQSKVNCAVALVYC